MWVPYPLSTKTWEVLAGQNGFTGTRLLATVPSRFFGEIYSAVSFNGGLRQSPPPTLPLPPGDFTNFYLLHKSIPPLFVFYTVTKNFSPPITLFCFSPTPSAPPT